jgi:hypothetical protein
MTADHFCTTGTLSLHCWAATGPEAYCWNTLSGKNCKRSLLGHTCVTMTSDQSARMTWGATMTSYPISATWPTWCGVTNTFGVSVYFREYTSPISLFIRKNLKNSFTADAENVHHLLEDVYTLFSVFRATLLSASVSMLATVCSVLFQFLQASWIIRINSREWTKVLLVNAPCSHLHSFCANGVGSGLPTRVTLTWVSREGARLFQRDGPATDFIFVT